MLQCREYFVTENAHIEAPSTFATLSSAYYIIALVRYGLDGGFTLILV